MLGPEIGLLDKSQLLLLFSLLSLQNQSVQVISGSPDSIVSLKFGNICYD